MPYKGQHVHSPPQAHIPLTPDAVLHSRRVKLDDDELAALALDTKLGISWPDVLQSSRVSPARWQQHECECGDFAVYTRQQAGWFGVLAMGAVPACVAEILNVLQSYSSEQHAQQMRDVFGDQCRDGSLIHRVDVKHDVFPAQSSTRDGSELVELSVKSATFAKPGWTATREEWCFLDAVYRGEAGTGIVEKFLTTMQAIDVSGSAPLAASTSLGNALCGYLLRPEAENVEISSRSRSAPANPPSANAKRAANTSTRVTLFAECHVQKQFGLSATGRGWGRSMAAEKATKGRLLKLAQSTRSLMTLVRRQRLGIQVLVDSERFLPPTNTPCNICWKRLLVAKLCRLCGQAVCADCSSKHERARQRSGVAALEIAQIRACVACLARVDQAEYSNVAAATLLGTHVGPDATNAKPPAALLKELLHNALRNAPTEQRKNGVLHLIRCMLREESSEESVSPCVVLVTPTSSDDDHLHALDRLHVAAFSDADLRSDDHRSYQLDSTGDAATTAVSTPVPANEDARLLAVRRISVPELAALAELEILCDVAAKEMGCAMSAISVVDRDVYYAVASNADAMRNISIPREGTICSHTMMEYGKPLVVVHPEADIRVNKFGAVDALGVRFYCAFPLIGHGGQVVGTMCCLNDASLEISAAQFAAFRKLAATASRIVRMHSKRRTPTPVP